MFSGGKGYWRELGGSRGFLISDFFDVQADFLGIKLKLGNICKRPPVPVPSLTWQILVKKRIFPADYCRW